MPRLFVPTSGASDWRRLLADPSKQWRRGKSAYELAVAWESSQKSASGFPIAISDVLATSEELRDARLIIGLPELQVELPEAGHASQNDLWALLEAGGELVSMTVEAKAGEPLGDTTAAWLAKGKPGNRRAERLAAVCEHLGLADAALDTVRYQLLHRTASAIIMAKRFRASKALLMVVSFDEKRDEQSFEAYKAFGALFGVQLEANGIKELPCGSSPRLFAGWVTASCASGDALGAAI